MAPSFDPYSEWLEVEDQRRPPTHYSILGVRSGESRAAVIEKHAQQQKLKLAPHLQGPDARLAKRLAFEIEAAKNCLIDAGRRAAYERLLHTPQDAKNQHQPARSSPAMQVPANQPPPGASGATHATHPAGGQRTANDVNASMGQSTPVGGLPPTARAVLVHAPAPGNTTRTWTAKKVAAVATVAVLMIAIVIGTTILTLRSDPSDAVADSQNGIPDGPPLAPPEPFPTPPPRATSLPEPEGLLEEAAPNDDAPNPVAADKHPSTPLLTPVPRSSATLPDDLRRWTDATGTHSVEAVLIEQDETAVLLERADGSRTRVQLDQLSRHDREYLRRQHGELLDAPARRNAEDPQRRPLDAHQVDLQVSPAVVHMRTHRGSASGFFVSRNLLVTNYHVVKEERSAEAWTQGQRYPVIGYVACEPRYDLVLLWVDRDADSPTLPIAKELPKKLDEVFAFGSPQGLEGTVTRGDVSAIRLFQDIRASSPESVWLGYRDDTVLIQMTSAISPGNSGGPLVNCFGEVVGVNTWTRRDGQSLNFAVAATHVQELLERGKDANVRSLVSLSRSRLPAPVDRTSRQAGIGMAALEVKLPDGRVVTRKSLTVPASDLSNFLKSGIPRLETEVHGVGEVDSGFLCPAGPTTFGLPDGFAFIRREGVERRPARNIFDIYEKEVEVQTTVGIIGFKSGRMDGHVVHLFDEPALYYGQWTAGRPSSRGLFFIETSSDVSAVMLRGTSGHISTMMLIRGGQVAVTFDSYDQAMASADGKSLIEVFEQCEAELQRTAERIIKAIQDEAKNIQADLIAQRQKITRANIANRINERRAEADAAQKGRMRDAGRRSGT